jgi:photosystem II stability/assembly factor-like uncharacterized protein
MKKKILLFAVLSIINLSLTIRNSYSQWTATNGLGGGFIWSITSSGSNLYAGTYGYGVYKSTDNGVNWVLRANGLKNTFIYSLAAAGSNIIAGTFGGIYYSSDEGSSWNVADTILTANKFVNSVSPFGTFGYVFAGTSYHNATDPKTMFISTNYGVTWAPTATNPNFGGTNTTIYCLKEFAGNLFAGTNQSIYKTTNSGVIWNQMTGGTIGNSKTVNCLTVLNNSKILAGTNSSGVFWSLDLGSTWTQQNTGLPLNFSAYSMATIGSDIFLPNLGGAFFKATDGTSLSWTVTTSSGLFTKAVLPVYSSGSTLYAGTLGAGVFVSSNNASSWTHSTNGMKAVIIGCLSKNGATLIAGTQGNGIFISADNGSNWTQPDNTGLGNPSVNTIITSGTNLLAGTNMNIYLSTNNGISWTYSGTGIPDSKINCLTQSGSNYFAGADDHHVYKSTDNGATWSDLGAPGGGPVTSFATSGTNVYLGCVGNGVFVSTNGGTSWTNSVTGLNNLNIHSLILSGTSNIFAGTEGGVFFSSNSGSMWTGVSNTSNGMPPVTVYSLANDGSNVIAGTFNGVYLTTNNGTNWFRKNQGLGLDTMSQCLLVTNGYVYSGMFPGLPLAGQTSPLVWKRTLSEIISVRNISTVVPDKFSLMQNYPNPFNPSTKIRFDLPASSRVNLSVYDITGKKVSELINERFTSGSYEYNFNASNLPSGTYIYRLQTDTYSDAKRMILVK